MSIQIANRYRPFSKQQGSDCLLPSTFFVIKAFPAYLEIQNEDDLLEVRFSLTGPITDFLIMQDIEKSKVLVSGFAKEGYFQYSVQQIKDELIIKLERGSLQAFVESAKGFEHNYQLNEKIILEKKQVLKFKTKSQAQAGALKERISFGCHKAQDFDLIKRRKDPIEFLPLWFAIGQTVPNSLKESSFYSYKKLLREGQKEAFLQKLSELFEAGFSSLFAPKKEDAKFLGIKDLEGKELKLAAREGYELIRSMLIEKQEGVIQVLKNLPSTFHAGRAINIQIEEDLVINILWSKKSIKKLQLVCIQDKKLSLEFESSLKSCRLTFPNQTKKQLDLTASLELSLPKGFYQLDRFEK